MKLQIFFLCALLYGWDFGLKYPLYSKFLTISNVKGKLPQLSPNRLLLKNITDDEDFESAVTKSYGDMEILRKNDEYAFFHISNGSRILHEGKKYLAEPIEIFFEGKDFNDFDLFGGFNPSLELYAIKRNDIFEVHTVPLPASYDKNSPLWFPGKFAKK